MRRRIPEVVVFLWPWAVGFVVLTLGPLLFSLGASLTRWEGDASADGVRWVGGQYYRAALAVEPALSGQAGYRSGEHANAVEAWSRLDAADAHYNRGNALAHLGEYDAAIQAYDEALAVEPGMEDALTNHALLEQMKHQQEQQREGEDGESGESEPSDDRSDGDSAQRSEGAEGEEGGQSDEREGEQPEGEQAEGETGEKEGEPIDYALAWSEEDAQVMEQWLRRIPDDPGGLLRRKFRNQHQRRGAPKDEIETW